MSTSKLPHLLLLSLVDLRCVRDVRGEVLHALPEGREKVLHVVHLPGAALGISLEHGEAVPELPPVACTLLPIGL